MPAMLCCCSTCTPEGSFIISPVRLPISQVNLDFDMESESQVLLLVHDTKPPFLAGKVRGSAISWESCGTHVSACCNGVVVM